ncbi:hypothetical protein FQN49_002540 [Arthroderma sp. PD_2]|nr:hypothetical protein FQN49_002540 [Arthroderma sp. PD_2]
MKYHDLLALKVETARWALKRKVEAGKRLDEKSCPPWGPRAWEAARKARCRARRNGTLSPGPLRPVIITNSGPFTSPQKVQEVANLPSVPEVKWANIATYRVFDESQEPREKDKVQYCMLTLEQVAQIEEYSHGEEVTLWLDGNRRSAWLGYSKAENICQWEALREACRNGMLRGQSYPVIVPGPGPLISPQKEQKIINFLTPPYLEVRETSRAKWFEAQLAEPREQDKLHFYEVDTDQLSTIEARYPGEDVMVWIKGQRRCAWLPDAVKVENECRFQAYRETRRKQAKENGMHPVVISIGTCLTLPREIRRFVSLSPSKVKETGRATWSEDEPKGITNRIRVDYYEVKKDVLDKIKARTNGENVLIWIHGERELAWQPLEMK